jgi:hypothetical protein
MNSFLQHILNLCLKISFLLFMQEIVTSCDFTKLCKFVPYLFSEQFHHGRWPFIPCCVQKYWILLCADLKNVKIHIYNSLNPSTNKAYLEMNLPKLVWLKYFLSTRFGKYLLYISFFYFLYMKRLMYYILRLVM